MSIAGILSSSLSNFGTQAIQSKMRQFAQDFQQLGQDLQSGNLSAAQADFAGLQQLAPQNSNSSASGSTGVSQAFSQLATDLQSGNLGAAQQDFATIQQDLANRATHHRHHHHAEQTGATSAISESLAQLGQALQSGSLSAAQQAYTSLQQEFEQFAGNNTSSATSTQSGSSNISVTA